MNRTTTDGGIMEAGFYVMDAFATTLERAIVSGPHATVRKACDARRDCNIAADCDIVELHREPGETRLTARLREEAREQAGETRGYAECDGHPAGPHDPMGVTTYCDGTCAGSAVAHELA